MKKYQHATLSGKINNAEELVRELDRLGNEGWELITILDRYESASGNSSYRGIFRREVTDHTKAEANWRAWALLHLHLTNEELAKEREKIYADRGLFVPDDDPPTPMGEAMQPKNYELINFLRPFAQYGRVYRAGHKPCYGNLFSISNGAGEAVIKHEDLDAAVAAVDLFDSQHIDPRDPPSHPRAER